eukprot:2582506-Alexandrium_andersonii.AAC.1
MADPRPPRGAASTQGHRARPPGPARPTRDRPSQAHHPRRRRAPDPPPQGACQRRRSAADQSWQLGQHH